MERKTENAVLTEFFAEFLLERRLDVDVTEDAESFVFERCDCRVDDIVEIASD
ncbi:hypothetical protein ACFQL0_12580 [Haloplanus litoreus]|uniref:Halobacterial output domain-containing protein n=1 Tax=Haloplanus litoreus TaxID=767515 RepID=A0ABD6A0H7_9EURY